MAVSFQPTFCSSSFLSCQSRRSCSCSPVTCGSSSNGPATGAPPRPVVILPGLGNSTNDYSELKLSLESKGLVVTTAQVSRPDWLRNALGLLDRNYWAGRLTPRPVLDWYFERIEAAIAAAKEQRGSDTKVSLVGHSAGGWLARVYMSEFGVDDIGMLLSLGTPHLPSPKGIPGVIDQTRGLLDYVNEICPSTCFAPDVHYVCVAGRFLKGDRFFPAKMPEVKTTGVGTLVSTNKEQAAPIFESDVETLVATEKENVSSISEFRNGKNNNEAEKKQAITLQSRLVGQSYKQVCGQADVWGDGVVPQISAHLEGAKNITLDGVYHSPVGSRLPDRPWYGSAGILEKWVQHLV